MAGTDDMFKAFEEESDAFFDSLMNDAPPALVAAPAAMSEPPALVQAPAAKAAPPAQAASDDTQDQMRLKMEERKAKVETQASAPATSAPAQAPAAQVPKAATAPATSTPTPVAASANPQPKAVSTPAASTPAVSPAAQQPKAAATPATSTPTPTAASANPQPKAASTPATPTPATPSATPQPKTAPPPATPTPAAQPAAQQPKAATTPATSTPAAAAAAPQPKATSTAATSTAAAPSPKAASPSATAAPAAPSVAPRSKAPAPATFSMDNDDDCPVTVDPRDLQPPAAPDAPSDFTPEDIALRTALIEFYSHFKADNIANVNQIVAKYRGLRVSELWAALATKYSLPSPEVIELMARTLYVTSPFEYTDDRVQESLEQMLQELRGSSSPPPDRSTMLRTAIERGAVDGSDSALRLLCFRGIPDESKLRPQVWKVLLGYLPMDRHTEWNAIQGEKRALYASYRSDLLTVTEDFQVTVNDEGHRANEKHESEELLNEIRQDVDRTRRDFDYFRKPSTRCSMIAMLFIYARLNPGVRYVQGMNEVAAIILHVLASDPVLSATGLEADCFWCFSELMVEIKGNFMQAMDNSDEGIHALVAAVQTLLKNYDPELAKHLEQAELPAFVFAFRWCTLLFAQDTLLPDVVRLWDSMIADPRRYEFCVHTCVAAVIAHREELLKTTNTFALAEILQTAPKQTDFDLMVRRAMAICAFERREQNPPFPPKSTFDDISDDLKEVAQKAAAIAGGAAVHLQENIAPIVQEKASVAAAAAAEVASHGAQAAQVWLEETAPARKEAMEKASTHLSSLWSSVRATAVATSALAATKAAEYGQGDAVDKLSTFYGKASAAASAAAREWNAASDPADAPTTGGYTAEPAEEPVESEAPQLVPAAAASPAPNKDEVDDAEIP